MSKPISVVSYNVLSSHLGGADYFTSCVPEYLNASYRLKKIQQILQIHMDRNAIICLQEVSMLWLGILHALCASHGYYLISGMYGKKFNGYMGVCIAVPMNQYNIMDVDIKTISDTKYRQPKAPVPPSSMLMNMIRSIWNLFHTLRMSIYSLITKPVDNMWSIALGRENQLVSVRLQSKDAGQRKFVVGNYHMPCIFDKPQVMMIHTSLSVQHLQKRAGSDPLIYCGDFNSKPDSAMYQLITQGRVDDQDPAKPEKHFVDDVWQIDNLQPMTSAYKAANKQEPQFTNFSKVKEQEVFIETLDYIFLSSHWKVVRVEELLSKAMIIAETSGRPLPDKDYPSDHLLIAADLQL